MTFTPSTLADFQPKHAWFVGVDSDGTTFNTMAIKHTECFIPLIIEIWNLESVADQVRETAEFINLYSQWRGIDRWRGLVMTFDLLRERGIAIPEMPRVRAFVADEAYPKSDTGLRSYQTAHPGSDLQAASEWSMRVNALFAAKTQHVPPFAYVRESFRFLFEQTDLVVVSSMPLKEVMREWSENDLLQYVSAVGAQETGSKQKQIQLATQGKYLASHVLMVGDAPGDRLAAHANGALFYPIYPGHEEASWKGFYEEGMRQFLKGEYAGMREAARIDQFKILLRDIPPWVS